MPIGCCSGASVRRGYQEADGLPLVEAATGGRRRPKGKAAGGRRQAQAAAQPPDSPVQIAVAQWRFCLVFVSYTSPAWPLVSMLSPMPATPITTCLRAPPSPRRPPCHPALSLPTCFRDALPHSPFPPPPRLISISRTTHPLLTPHVSQSHPRITTTPPPCRLHPFSLGETTLPKARRP